VPLPSSPFTTGFDSLERMWPGRQGSILLGEGVLAVKDRLSGEQVAR
jgi:hypothetical protein